MEQTLLVVDDDAMNRDALSRRLKRAGYSVLTAESGTHALATVSTNRVDAVLLDVMMPGLSGIETLRRLRQTRSASDLPVIMVTANGASSDIVEALDLGANDYVTKPVDFPVALARIRTQMSTRRADSLTGLPNRAQFMDRLEHLMSQGDAAFALLFLDVDAFKQVNDSMGHLAGDELLVSIARRLEGSLRTTDTVSRFDGEHTVARLGGDEFTVLLHGVRAAGDAQAIGDRLLAAITQPLQIQGRDVASSVSIGVVVREPHYQRAEDMVRDADAAMYRAKALGKSRCELFDMSMAETLAKQRQLEADLRGALDRQELHVYYQPIVALSGERLRGFEALVRWHHPTQGLVLPDEFIPTAEATGLIVPIGGWVLEEACRQMRAWEHEFPEHADLAINVNLSGRQVLEPGIVQTVRDVLAKTGLAAHRLKLEITESVVLERSEAVVDVLTELRALGVKLGLDDFGMGYSALGYLQRFPFNTLKIDRSFVNDMHETGSAEIVRAIISLAAGLSMDVTAEGVETAEQLAHLQGLDCEFGQGFLFSRPLTSDDAKAILGDRRSTAPVRHTR